MLCGNQDKKYIVIAGAILSKVIVIAFLHISILVTLWDTSVFLLVTCGSDLTWYFKAQMSQGPKCYNFCKCSVNDHKCYSYDIGFPCILQKKEIRYYYYYLDHPCEIMNSLSEQKIKL